MDSSTTVENYIVKSDDIRVSISGLIERAEIIRKQQNPDNSVEVTVEMPLRGDLSQTLVQKPKTKPVKLKSALPRQIAKSRSFTGLVVDARGTGANPALAPRIFDEEGQEAYSVAYVEAPELINNGIVIYVPDISIAQQHPRVTSEPLIVKAVKATGLNKSDLVISNADAQTIHAVPSHYQFLEKAQVLVVLDTRN